MIHTMKDELILPILLEYKKIFEMDSTDDTNCVLPTISYDEMDMEQQDMVEYIVSELFDVTQEQAIEAVNQLGDGANDIGMVVDCHF